MHIPEKVCVEVITPDECECLIQDISRTLKKPVDFLARPNSVVAVLDDTVMNIWPGPEVNMKFPWCVEHPVDSLKYTCSDRAGRFDIGHVVLRNKVSYLELKLELMRALAGKNLPFN
jgi:hypothetical protein